VAEPHDVAARRFDLLVGLAAAMHRPLGAILHAADDNTGPASSRAASVSEGQAFLVELTRVANCSGSEAPERLDVSKTIRDAVADADALATRRAVRLSVDLPAELVARSRPRTLSLLVRTLIDHAILATPRDGTVMVSVKREGPLARKNGPGNEGAWTIAVTDGGPVVPVAARADLLEHRVDPTALGRPPGIGLLVAHAATAQLGGTLTIGESPSGAAMAQATLTP
jgi:signal transduction histidine kinase